MDDLVSGFDEFERTGKLPASKQAAPADNALWSGFAEFERKQVHQRAPAVAPATKADAPKPTLTGSWLGDQVLYALPGLGTLAHALGPDSTPVDRGVVQGINSMVNSAALLGGMPVAAGIDTLTGRHAAADAVGKFIDQSGALSTALAPKADAGTAERVTQNVASFVPDLATMMMTGGASVLPKLAARGATESALSFGTRLGARALEHSAKASIVPAASHAVTTAQAAIDAGATPAQALAAGGVSALTDVAANAVPLSVPGGLIKRTVTGAASGVGTELAQNALLNTVLPEGAQRQSDGESLATNAGVQALMAALLGPRAGQSMLGEHVQPAPKPEPKPAPAARPAPRGEAPAQPPSPVPAAATVPLGDILAQPLPESGLTRAQLIEAWRQAQTPDAKAHAAARIAALDAAQRAAPAPQQPDVAPAPLGDLLAQPEPTPAVPEPAASTPQKTGPFSLPATDLPAASSGGDLTMQNRDRARAASVAQMQAIARNPDPELLSFSRDPNTGAPMVSSAADGPPPQGAALGREDFVKMADGRRIPVRYAVVDANAVQASHDADGVSNPAYADAPLRALNNGRTAGLQAAWRRGDAAAYRSGIEADAGTHGVDAQAIAGMKRPMLVRLYDRAHDAGDMAAASNASAQLGLSPVEQATTDARALPSLDSLQVADDGSISHASNRSYFRTWFQALGQNETAKLIDAKGEPNAAAMQRLNAAIIARAYGDERLLTAMVEDLDPDQRNILSALRMAAPAFAKVEHGGALGNIADVAANGFEMVREAKRRSLTVDEFIAQQDMLGRDAQAERFAQFYSDNMRAPRRMADGIASVARFVEDAQVRGSSGSLFGDAPAPTIEDALRYANEQLRAEHGQQAKGFDLGADDRRVAESGRGGGQYQADRRAAAGVAEGDRGEPAAGRFGLTAPEAGQVAPGAARPASQPGLFAAPTHREQLSAEAARRDAARNGLDQPGRKDMLGGDGELFAGPRPEQGDLATTGGGEPGARGVQVLQLPDGTPTEFSTPRPLKLTPSGSMRTGGDGTPRGQMDLFMATKGNAAPGTGHEPAAKIDKPKLLQRAAPVRVGQFRSGIERVQNLSDAAHVLAPLRKSASEQFMVLALDADGKPLAILRHTMGGIDQSSVFSGDVMGAVAAIPGVHSVVFGHNHPSGNITPSSADLRMDRMLNDLFRGSGILIDGAVIVAPGGRKAATYDSATSRGSVDVSTAPRRADVPVVERRLTRSMNAAQQADLIATPQKALQIAADAKREGTPAGIMWLTHTHALIGIMPADFNAMRTLRTGDQATSQAALVREAKGANAAAAILFGHRSELGGMNNVASALAAADIRVLDALTNEGDGAFRSMENVGLLMPDATFYSRRGAHDDITQAGIPKGLQAAQTADTRDLARAINADLARAGTAERVRLREIAHDDLPQELRVALDAFGDATGTRAVVFRNLTPDVLDVNGVNLRDGRLFLSENADRPLVTVAGHEFTHQLRKDAPELYTLLEAEVRRQGDLAGFAAKLGKQGERNPERVAPEELTANAVGDALSDRDFLQHLAERNPGVFKRVAEAFTRFLDGLLAKLGSVRDLGSNRYLRDVQAFRDVLADVLAKYAPKHTPPEAGRVLPDDPAYQRVWHGSPHRFENFSLHKIGSGEGHQAFGWGIYFASKRELGEHYRDTLSRPSMDDVALFNMYKNRRTAGLSVEDARRQTIKWAESNWQIENQDQARETVERFTDGGMNNGHLYNAEAPEDHELLDWDKPLSEQPEGVRKALEPLRQAYRDRPTYDLPYIDESTTGENIYREIRRAEIVKLAGSPGDALAAHPNKYAEAGSRAASERLKELGIPGLRYLDGASRASGEGSRNYVIWNEGAISDVQPHFQRRSEQTDTPEFRRWFGASKVVNADGTPRTVYHGTGAEFWAFNGDRLGDSTGHMTAPLGHFFAEDRAKAERYAEKAADYVPADQRVIDAHLSISNPKRMTLDELMAVDNPDAARALRARLERDGYDGIHVPEIGQWVAFEPTQIKSASENRGSFDPQNADIRYSRGDPGERDLAGDTRTKLARMQASEARRQADAGRAAVLSKLAADGYPLGAPGWQQDTGRWEGVRGTLHDARVVLQDKLLAMRDAQEDIEQAVGGVLHDSMNAYRLENLMHGRVGDAVNGLAHDYVEPLQRRMHNLGVNVAQLQDFLLARHAPERNARIAEINPAMPDGGSGMTTAQAHAVLAGEEAGAYSGKIMDADTRAKLEQLAQTVDALRAHTLERLLQSGQITQELHDALTKTYQHYVPLRGKADDLADEFGHAGDGTGRGASATRQNIRRALGRGEGNLPKDILGELIGDAQRAELGAEKANVGRALLKLAMAHPNEKVWTVEPADLEWKFSETTGEAYLGPKNRAEDMDSTLLVNEGGTLYRVRFNDPRLAKAMLNLGARDLSAIARVAGPVMRYLSATLTSYNPGFVPINMTRDLGMGMAGLAAEHGPAAAARTLRLYPEAMAAAFSDFKHRAGDADVPDARKTMLDWAREFAEAGGQTNIGMIQDAGDITRALERGAADWRDLLAQGKPLAAAAKPLAPIAHAVERINVAVENALRLSAYVTLRERGSSRDKAAEYAKNLTVNFNRKGSFGQVANALYLFFNASVQGAHRVATLIRDNPKTIGAGMAALASLQATFALALMGDQDEQGLSTWDTIPDYRKQTSLIIPAPWSKDGYFALPLAYGFNWFGYMGGRLAQAAKYGKNDKGNVAVDLIMGATRAFSPLPMDEGLQGAAPFLVSKAMQLASNRDDLGRPIAKDGGFQRYDVPKAATGRVDTPRIYKQAAWALNRIGGGDDFTPPVYMSSLTDVAPEQLEYLTSMALGGLGSTANKAMKFVEGARAGSYASLPEALSNAPIVSSFGIEGNRMAASSSAFYTQRDVYERNLDRLRAAYTKGGVAAFKAERERLGTEYTGIHLAQYVGMSRNGRHVPGDVRVTSTGNPVLVAAPGSLFAAHKESTAAAGELTRAIQRLRGDDPMTVGEVLRLAAGDGNRRKAADAIGAVDAPRGEQASAIQRRKALDYVQERRQQVQDDYLLHANKVRKGLKQSRNHAG